jgi:sulfur carrier protein
MGQAREIRVNGQDVCLNAATIAGLLVEQAIDTDRRGIAVALNGSVIPRAAWGETALRPGDSIEIVRAMQGG